MHDLDDLRVFERVAALGSFSAAARSLSRPKSTISRSIARLEASLGVRLIQRTTRNLALTPAGEAMMSRCSVALTELTGALDYVGSLAKTPQGRLKVSCGVAYGYHILAGQLPAFIKSFPLIDVQIDVTSRVSDMVQDRVDVAIRMGPIADSSNVAVRLGSMSRLMCASKSYFDGRSQPGTLEDLRSHDLIEMPGHDGRPRLLRFRRAEQEVELAVQPRIEVNDALAISRLVKAGAGIGIISNYLCYPEIAAGSLVRILPEWVCPPVDISLVFPTRRELSPVVRAFVEFMKAINGPTAPWQDHPAQAV